MDQPVSGGKRGCCLCVFLRNPPSIDNLSFFLTYIIVAIVAELVDLYGIMGDEQGGHTLSAQLANLRKALLPEGLVADGEELVGQDNVRFQMDGYCKA